ncbi:MAG: DNA polymerase I [Clostridia bacterium]|nr:DNA polymerase I [Clostridia bacterium]
MKNILVVDGNSILNRAFYGIRPLTTKEGKHTHAIYGMLNILLRHLEGLKPDYAAVAFDLKAPNFRKLRFPYYKEGRHPTPPELLSQFDDAKECLRLLGFHTLELEGYEADDILGTVAAMAKAETDVHAYVLSGDRDLLQLIDDDTTVLLATTGETISYDEAAFVAKYGIPSAEFVDLKALMGDSSDNIPGVPGVGEKTAIKLIDEFHSLEGIYENLEARSISAGLRDKLENGKGSAYDSRFLATICREVPLGLSLSDLVYEGVHCDEMYRKCTELEFSQLIRKLNLLPCQEGGCCGDTCAAPAVSFSTATLSPEDVLAKLPAGSKLALDYENGLSLFDGKTLYTVDGDLPSLAPLFDGSYSVILHDGKRLLRRLFREGVKADFVPLDVMLYAYVLNSSENASDLSALCLRHLGETAAEGVSFAPFLYRLEETLSASVAKEDCASLLYDVELPLAAVLAEMEENGFRIDTEALEAYGRRLAEEIACLAENIEALAGHPFNINSPKQLSELLFDELGLPTKGLKKNKNGFSTDAETLQGLRHAHPIIDSILAYRQFTKLHSTYVMGLLKAADKQGFLHTDFKQALTATGRLSSAEPNLQNIPIRTAAGRELRRVFIPKEKDYVLIDADYSQIELRLMADFSGDERMCSAFREGADVHRRTAAAVFGIPEESVSDELRLRAKAVNFGIIYGISAYSLSGDIGTSVSEAKRYIEGYFTEFPRVRTYLDDTVKAAEELGYTTTRFGRRRYIPELTSSAFPVRSFGKRVAMNSPIQGSAADIMKIATLRVAKRLKEEIPDAHLVMQVHDELIAEAKREDAARVCAILKEEMEAAASLSVPLTVSTGVGPNWLEAEH